ncbi:MAG: hypothetical protein DRQ39_10270 [Gammaproteobacteria bacterium]|nr:MAG: hypothetical protein DRQ39_10270 [Gammaproteobacteria bacterium]
MIVDAIECDCVRHRTEDDFHLDKSRCHVHGPESTDETKVAYLQKQHSETRDTNQEALDDLRSTIMCSLHGGDTISKDIPGAIIAALIWCRDHNDNELPRAAEDTQASRQLAYDHGVLPE